MKTLLIYNLAYNSIAFVNPPCVCDRGDISCSSKEKFDDDDDDDDDDDADDADDDDDDDDDLPCFSYTYSCIILTHSSRVLIKVGTRSLLSVDPNSQSLYAGQVVDRGYRRQVLIVCAIHSVC